MNNSALIAKNNTRWDNATFKASALKQAKPIAKRLVAAKDVYINISTRTGVPWFIIAVIHERESSQRWDRSLAQGDPWNKVSTHIPKGRGPFKSFEDAAYDALTHCAPYAAKWEDWSMGGGLTLLEIYNGVGYFNKGLPSPYIWAGTNQYKSGKYVSDGVFDPNVVDTQLGCAVLLDAMNSIDPSVSFDLIKKPYPKSPKPTEAETTAIEAPKAGPVGTTTDDKPAVQSTTIWASIIGVLTAMGAATQTLFEKALGDWKILAMLGMGGLFGYVIYMRFKKQQDIKGILS